MLSSHRRLGLPSGLFPSGFSTKTLYTPLLSTIHATCKYDSCCLLNDYCCYIRGSAAERHLSQPHCTRLYKSVNIKSNLNSTYINEFINWYVTVATCFGRNWPLSSQFPKFCNCIYSECKTLNCHIQ